MAGYVRHGHRPAGSPATPTYRSWSNMRQRCNNPRHAKYAHYGGRGIKVCERWSRFENFLADMGERPAGKSLDRWPDNDGNYEPGNCRWASQPEQLRNTRRSVRLVVDGMEAALNHWSRTYGVPPYDIRNRLRLGWSPEQAVKVPHKKRMTTCAT